MPKRKRHTIDLKDIDPNDEVVKILLDDDGLEPITEELISELVAKGWPMADLKSLQANGFRYHRGRNSVFGPTQAF